MVRTVCVIFQKCHVKPFVIKLRLAACGSPPLDTTGVIYWSPKARGPYVLCEVGDIVLTVYLVIEITTLMNMRELIDSIQIWEMYTCLLIKVEYINIISGQGWEFWESFYFIRYL